MNSIIVIVSVLVLMVLFWAIMFKKYKNTYWFFLYENVSAITIGLLLIFSGYIVYFFG